MTDIARSTSYACPNNCGNGVSRSDKHPTWHCWRCRVDAVEVEFVTLRAADYEGVVGALDSIAEVLDRGIPDDRKLATVVRLVNAARGNVHAGPSASAKPGVNAGVRSRGDA